MGGVVKQIRIHAIMAMGPEILDYELSILVKQPDVNVNNGLYLSIRPFMPPLGCVQTSYIPPCTIHA